MHLIVFSNFPMVVKISMIYRKILTPQLKMTTENTYHLRLIKNYIKTLIFPQLDLQVSWNITNWYSDN